MVHIGGKVFDGLQLAYREEPGKLYQCIPSKDLQKYLTSSQDLTQSLNFTDLM